MWWHFSTLGSPPSTAAGPAIQPQSRCSLVWWHRGARGRRTAGSSSCGPCLSPACLSAQAVLQRPCCAQEHHQSPRYLLPRELHHQAICLRAPWVPLATLSLQMPSLCSMLSGCLGGRGVWRHFPGAGASQPPW